MKKFVLLITALIIPCLTFAQEAGFNYKALVTDNGNPLPNATINVRFTILRYNNTVVYSEEHNGVSTDQHGIFSAIIGEGTPVSGTYSHTMFRDYGNLKIKVEIDTGSGYQDFGTEIFKYVPYAAAARHLKLAEWVYIGRAPTSGQRLYVEDDPPGQKLVEFYFKNPTNEQDVLRLFMDAPTSGTAQFIEAFTNGSGTVFKLNHDGSILMNGNLHVGGKIKTSRTGYADLKPFAYGEVTDTGSYMSSKSTNGFTVQRISTGKYKITLTGISDDNYIPIVSAWENGGGEIATYEPHNGFFYVYITNGTGTLRDSYFSFVVFRR